MKRKQSTKIMLNLSFTLEFPISIDQSKGKEVKY